jgi:ribosomal protein S3
VRVNLSYSLTHSWNIFGSFGIKVWIYKSIVKHAARI